MEFYQKANKTESKYGKLKLSHVILTVNIVSELPNRFPSTCSLWWKKGFNEKENVLKLAIPTRSGTLSLTTTVRILVTVHMAKADKLFSVPNSKFFHKQRALGLSLVTVCSKRQDSAWSPVEFLVKTVATSSSGWRCFQDSCSEKFLMSQILFPVDSESSHWTGCVGTQGSCSLFV